MRVVVLTNNGSRFGKSILLCFRSMGIAVEGTVVVHQSLRYHWSLLRNVYRRVGALDTAYFVGARVLAPTRPLGSDWSYPALCASVIHTKGGNSAETIVALRRLQPDIVVLGQTGIVRQAVLDVPRLGTLNVHPGILPFYRGVDCARWAICNDEPERVGNSVHWVDAGVDTGRLIATRTTDLRRVSGLRELDELLEGEGVELLGDVVRSMLAGEVPVGAAQAAGTQFYKMSRKLERDAIRKLRERSAGVSRAGSA